MLANYSIILKWFLLDPYAAIYIYASAEWTHHQQLQVAAAGFQENGARLLNADIVLYNMYAIATNAV